MNIVKLVISVVNIYIYIFIYKNLHLLSFKILIFNSHYYDDLSRK